MSKFVYKVFRDGMERHKRLDSWIIAILLVAAFYYFLWVHNMSVALMVFVLIFILPFIFPKPERKLPFINDVIDWEVAWVTFPPYSKLIDWTIEAVGFSATIYGAWYHEWLPIILGVLAIILGLIDFIVRFGFRRAIENIPPRGTVNKI